MTALDTVLNVKSRSVASKTLFVLAFCHMAVFSCCDVLGDYCDKELPEFTQNRHLLDLQSQQKALDTPATRVRK